MEDILETESKNQQIRARTRRRQSADPSTDLISQYLHDIGAWPLLTHHQEFKLGVVVSATTALVSEATLARTVATGTDDEEPFCLRSILQLPAAYQALQRQLERTDGAAYPLVGLVREAMLLRETYLDSSPSDLLAWLLGYPLRECDAWKDLCHAAVGVLRILFLLPVETQAQLNSFIRTHGRPPPSRKLATLLPDPVQLERDLEELKDKHFVARDALVTANLRLVFSLAKRYRYPGMELSDCVSEGNLGLFKAVEKYDPAAGTRFSTYAFHWIRQSISRAVSNQSRAIRLPVHVIEQINRLKRAISQYEQLHGEPPAPEVLLHDLELIPDYIQEELHNHTTFGAPLSRETGRTLRQLAKRIDRLLLLGLEIESLDEPIYMDRSATRGDQYADPQQADVDKDIIAGQLREELQQVLLKLKPRQRKILELRYGLTDGVPRTLAQIGAALNVSRERIRQIESKALRILRNPAISGNLSDHRPS